MMEYSNASQGLATWVDYDIPGARSAVQAAARRTADLVRSVERPDIRASALEWSVAETAAHLVVVAEANAGYAAGSSEPVLELERLSETNQVRIDEIGDRRCDVLAARLEAGVDRLLDATATRGAHDPLPWHSRTAIPVGAILGVVLGELMLHGADIARSQSRKWRISAADALHVVRGAFAFAPHALDRRRAEQHPITFIVHCSGVPRTYWHFGDGVLRIGLDDGRRADCHVAVTPVPFILVAYGRRSALRAALRGQALSWGRRPLAAFRFASYFTS
jgi:uncharacterized protein (TIGR03083 family)